MSGRSNIGVDEALECARALAPDLPAELVPVPRTAGRVLAEDVRAGRDLPAVASSAMDGWAVRASDTPGRLAAAGESAAGQPSDAPLVAGGALAISTGAALPAAYAFSAQDGIQIREEQFHRPNIGIAGEKPGGFRRHLCTFAGHAFPLGGF